MRPGSRRDRPPGSLCRSPTSAAPRYKDARFTLDGGDPPAGSDCRLFTRQDHDLDGRPRGEAAARMTAAGQWAAAFQSGPLPMATSRPTLSG
ncbi:hypothetical protein GCM10023085_14590 [Actinomadura viridis]